MNEVGGGQPGQSFELPPAAPGERAPEAPAEKQRPLTESAPKKQSQPAADQPLPVIPDLPSQSSTPTADDSQTAVSSPKTAKLPAEERDLIEKQWIEKAKEIVAETKSDPYKQKNEMSRAKADYIQKRFKKTIKTDGAPA